MSDIIIIIIILSNPPNTLIILWCMLSWRRMYQKLCQISQNQDHFEGLMKIFFSSDINSVKWLCSGAETDVDNYGVNARKH